MREILFKAKTFKGKWVQGLLAHKDNKWYISNKEGMPFAFEVRPETIGQYTGLKDKNGNKIWENDIIKKHFYTDYNYYANSEEYIGFVRNEDLAWVVKSQRGKYILTLPIFMAISESKDAEYFEVIGNIFDNPEALNCVDDEALQQALKLATE